MPARAWAAGPLAALAAAAALGGCANDGTVYSEGGDAKVRAAARGVVARNLKALARGDGRTFCGTYTPRFLRTYRGGYAACVASFKRRVPRARPPRIRFGRFLTASATKVSVELRQDGGRVQSYDLVYAAPAPQVGSAKRWLIDLESVEER